MDNITAVIAVIVANLKNVIAILMLSRLMLLLRLKINTSPTAAKMTAIISMIRLIMESLPFQSACTEFSAQGVNIRCCKYIITYFCKKWWFVLKCGLA